MTIRTQNILIDLVQIHKLKVLSMSMRKTLKEVETWIDKMGKEYPRVFGPFMVWMRRVEETAKLDTKTKELISVALAVATQCRWCIAQHTKNALEAGNTKDEIMEACFVACLFRGAPACMYGQLVRNTIEDYQSSTSNQ